MSTKPWTDQEWWDARLDRGALEKALLGHKIKMLAYGNCKPICPPKTDYGKVTEIAQGLIKKKRG